MEKEKVEEKEKIENPVPVVLELDHSLAVLKKLHYSFDGAHVPPEISKLITVLEVANEPAIVEAEKKKAQEAEKQVKEDEKRAAEEKKEDDRRVAEEKKAEEKKPAPPPVHPQPQDPRKH